jgi:thioredoxin:protein disulfide reductase
VKLSEKSSDPERPCSRVFNLLKIPVVAALLVFCAAVLLAVPPIASAFSLETGTPSSSTYQTIFAADTGTATAPIPENPLPDEDFGRIAQLLQNANIPFTLISFFGFGLLLSLTPCVFPMIPILSGIIAGQGATTSWKRSALLSASSELLISRNSR